MSKKLPPVEADLYAKEGAHYRDAWDILHAGIHPPHYPPSLEVFQHERKVWLDKGEPIAPRAFAEDYVERKRPKT